MTKHIWMERLCKKTIPTKPNSPSRSSCLFQKRQGRLCLDYARSKHLSRLRNLLQTLPAPGRRPPPPAVPRSFMSHMRLLCPLPLFLTGEDNPHAFIPGSATGGAEGGINSGLFSAVVPELGKGLSRSTTLPPGDGGGAGSMEELQGFLFHFSPG